MKQETKQFNFNLPEELKNYLGYMSSMEYSSISQYLIDLVNKDKQQKGLSISDIDYNSIFFSSSSETTKYVVMSLLKSDKRIEMRAVEISDQSHAYRDLFSELLRHHRTNRLEFEVNDIKIICHPVFKDHMKLTSKPPYTFECDELLSNIIVVYGSTPVVYAFVRGSSPYYNAQALAAYSDSKMDKTLDKYRIIQKVLADGTSQFYTKVLVDKHMESVYNWQNLDRFDTIGAARFAIEQHHTASMKEKRFGPALRGDMASAFAFMLSYKSVVLFEPIKPKRKPKTPIRPEFCVEVTEFFSNASFYDEELAVIESLFAPEVIEEIAHHPRG
jgi:hypothetical protein